MGRLRSFLSPLFVFCPGLLATLFGAFARAQDLPPGTITLPSSSASASTDVTKVAFMGLEKRDEKKQATELTVSGGGVQSGGNTRVLAVTAAARFRVRHDADQFKSVVATNYGQSALPGQGVHVTTENLQALTRYDHFIHDVTLFAAAQARHDRFQGLDLRLSFDPGVGYFFVSTKTQSLWMEAGYDLRYDIRRDDALVQLDATGAPVLVNGQPKLLDKTTTVHSSRLFFGFEAKIGQGATFVTGLEYLQSVTDPSIYRVNGDMLLSAKVSKKLAIALQLTERYEHEPLPGKLPLDVTESASLVYTFY